MYGPVRHRPIEGARGNSADGRAHKGGSYADKGDKAADRDMDRARPRFPSRRSAEANLAYGLLDWPEPPNGPDAGGVDQVDRGGLGRQSYRRTRQGCVGQD